jgi:hypothetical protein
LWHDRYQNLGEAFPKFDPRQSRPADAHVNSLKE